MTSSSIATIPALGKWGPYSSRRPELDGSLLTTRDTNRVGEPDQNMRDSRLVAIWALSFSVNSELKLRVVNL